MQTHMCRGTSLIRNSPAPQDHHKALGTGLLQGPRGRLFLMSEVPLYGSRKPREQGQAPAGPHPPLCCGTRACVSTRFISWFVPGKKCLPFSFSRLFFSFLGVNPTLHISARSPTRGARPLTCAPHRSPLSSEFGTRKPVKAIFWT